MFSPWPKVASHKSKFYFFSVLCVLSEESQPRRERGATHSSTPPPRGAANADSLSSRDRHQQTATADGDVGGSPKRGSAPLFDTKDLKLVVPKVEQPPVRRAENAYFFQETLLALWRFQVALASYVCEYVFLRGPLMQILVLTAISVSACTRHMPTSKTGKFYIPCMCWFVCTYVLCLCALMCMRVVFVFHYRSGHPLAPLPLPLECRPLSVDALDHEVDTRSGAARGA